MNRLGTWVAAGAILALAVAGISACEPAPARPASQRGVILWAAARGDYGTPAAARALDAIAAVGAGWVTVVPVWFQEDANASRLRPDPARSPSDRELRAVVAAAQDRGLHVSIKPHVDVDDGSWRGDIVPADPNAWFGDYRQMVGRYARLAADAGADQLVIGTELAGVSSHTARWRDIIEDARASFDGTLTYAALSFEYDDIRFWEQLDIIGVNAWWPLAAEPTVDVDRLRSTLAGHLDDVERFAAARGRPVLLTEAGFTSRQGTTTDPSSWEVSDVPAPDEQAAGYEAVMAELDERPDVVGVHWWNWLASDDAPPLEFTPKGKPAQDVLARWWR